MWIFPVVVMDFPTYVISHCFFCSVYFYFLVVVVMDFVVVMIYVLISHVVVIDFPMYCDGFSRGDDIINDPSRYNFC